MQVHGAISISNKIKKSIIALSVSTVILTLILAVLLTRSITNPVSKASILIKNLANGDFTSKVEINQKDEIGQLASSANILGQSLDNMCIRVKCSSSTINASAHNLDKLSASLFSATEIMSGSCNTVATAA